MQIERRGAARHSESLFNRCFAGKQSLQL